MTTRRRIAAGAGAAALSLFSMLGPLAACGDGKSGGGGIGESEDPNRPPGTEPRTVDPDVTTAR
jgi:hypothetical protein